MVHQPEKFSAQRIPGRMGIDEADRQRVLEAARRFRKVPTRGEQLLWQELRGARLGVKFRRQHPIGPLVVDFCCPHLRLIVEVDGPVHRDQVERDEARQRLLEERGYHVLRIETEEVEQDLPSALDRIQRSVQTLKQDSPSPKVGEGAGG